MKIYFNLILTLIVFSAAVYSADDADYSNHETPMNHSIWSIEEAESIIMSGDKDNHKVHQVVNCYDSFGIGYTGQVPHPTNCSCFLQCVEQSPGHPAPIIFTCDANLQFSLDHCQCGHPGEAVCFDLYNIDHEARRLRCAQPITRM